MDRVNRRKIFFSCLEENHGSSALQPVAQQRRVHIIKLQLTEAEPVAR
jgi:hypothetical protein